MSAKMDVVYVSSFYSHKHIQCMFVHMWDPVHMLYVYVHKKTCMQIKTKMHIHSYRSIQSAIHISVNIHIQGCKFISIYLKETPHPSLVPNWISFGCHPISLSPPPGKLSYQQMYKSSDALLRKPNICELNLEQDQHEKLCLIILLSFPMISQTANTDVHSYMSKYLSSHKRD